jgi:hypothetical protein
MRREGCEIESHGERKCWKIKSKEEEPLKLARVGGSWGERAPRPPQFRAGGVRTPPAAGCGGPKSPAPTSILTPRGRKGNFRESVGVMGGEIEWEFSF